MLFAHHQPLRVPEIARRGGQPQFTVARQEEPEPLVESHRGELGETGAAECHPHEIRTDPLVRQHLGGEDPPLLRLDVLGPLGHEY